VNLAVERTQLKDIELIAAGHLRSGNQRLVRVFDDLIRDNKRKSSLSKKLNACRSGPHQVHRGPGP